jgi:DNA-binding MarR family transcriptional regulator
MTPTLAPTRALTDDALDRFWETVPPLWGQIRGHIRAVAFENFRLGVEQFQVLRLIRSGKTSVSEIAAARNISRPAVSQAVDGLANRGLLTRTQDTEDRRHMELALTKQGNQLLDAVFSDTRAWMRTKMAGLNDRELENVVRAMQTLKKMLE